MSLPMKILFIISCAILGAYIGDAIGIYWTNHKSVAKPSIKIPPADVVRLVLPDGRTFCSGSVVSNTIAITAGHCVTEETPFGVAVNPNPIEIRGSDNISRKTFGNVIYVVPQLDFALLRGNFDVYTKFKMIDDVQSILDVRDGKPFFSCGYPLGGDLFCTKLKYKSTEMFMWSVEGVLIPGMSGGPVMTQDGHQFGINDAVDGDHAVISPIYNIMRGAK